MTEQKEDKPEQTNTTFDSRAFMRQKFIHREGEVDVSDSVLKEFFEKGAKAVWKVRGLTANEIAIANEAKQNREKVDAMVEAIASADKSDMVDGFRQWLGNSGDVHGEISKMLAQVRFGSIGPVIAEDVAVKIAIVAPVEFYQLNRKILELTGLGQVAGESKPSGTEQTSKKA